MQATITSTDIIVSVDADGKVMARAWEGITEKGVRFTAYITTCQVHRLCDNSEFERDLKETTKPAEAATLRAIDARLLF